MRVTVDLDLPAFEQALAGILPGGFSVDGLDLDAERMRLTLRAPVVGTVDLIARVSVRPGQLTLHDFDLEGAGLAKAFALGALRQRIADLDQRQGALHVWGESDGERAHLGWGEA